MTLATLRSEYDEELPTARYRLRTAASNAHCVETTSGGGTCNLIGTAGEIARGGCPRVD
jgi:hypothetical protein